MENPAKSTNVGNNNNATKPSNSKPSSHTTKVDTNKQNVKDNNTISTPEPRSRKASNLKASAGDTPPIPSKGNNKTDADNIAAATETFINNSNTFSSLSPSMFVTKSNTSFNTKYVKGVKLGAGAYGEVWSCLDRDTCTERAVKIIPKSLTNGPDKKIDFVNEVDVLRTLDHPNIMKIYACGEDDQNCYLVTDVYVGGELFDEIIRREKFTESSAAYFVQQVLSGVHYLHEKNIVHRDLKPENLLLDSKSSKPLIKIVDFGLSAIYNDDTFLRERVGSAYYIAPEVLKQNYGKSCDVWSVGVILYVLLSGFPPFGGDDDYEILSAVKTGKFTMEPQYWSNISSEAKDLIYKMMEVNVEKRYTAAECLAHPWFKKFDLNTYSSNHKPLMAALRNMRAYSKPQSLLKAATLFIGSKLTSHKETKELTKVFRMLDKNNDGKLDRDELIDGYKTLIEAKGFCSALFALEDIIADEVDLVLDSVDFDRNGYIDYSEFITVAMDREHLLSTERVEAAFKQFDTDNSGTIDVSELRKYLPNMTDEEWDGILSHVDENGDGEVDKDEFMKMMKSTKPANKKTSGSSNTNNNNNGSGGGSTNNGSSSQK